MPDERQQFPQGIETVSEWSPDLVGFEPTTNPFDLEDPCDARGFLVTLKDARRAGTAFYVVEDSKGRLAIWKLFTGFFIDEDPALPVEEGQLPARLGDRRATAAAGAT